MSYDFKNLITYVYPNVGNSNNKFYVNNVDWGYTPTDVHVDWRADSSIPVVNTASNGQSWKRVWVTFKTKDNLSMNEDHYVLFRAISDVDSNNNRRYPFYGISQIKLEEGNTPTTYSYSTHDWESYIDIKSNEIALNVRDGLKNTGINIESGHITLNADKTDVIGNLNIYSNNESGLTIYDSDNTPRVQIQPVNIGSMDDYNGGSFSFIHSNAYSTTATDTDFIVNTEPVNITVNANDRISIVNPIAYMSYNQQFCSASTATIRIYVKKGSSTVIDRTMTATLVANGTTHYYIYNGTIRFTASEAGTYQISARLTSSDRVEAGQTMFGDLAVRVEYSVEHQTIIGLDGMTSYAAANKYFWCGTDGVRIQNGNAGIQFREKPMQVLCNNAGLWLPFYNYVPIFKPTFTQQYIPHLQELKYAYRINPVNDFGYCLVDMPGMNNSYNKVESWVCLPDENFTVNGVTMTLPIGYRVKIINSTPDTRIYVTTYNDLGSVLPTSSGKQMNIMDDNGDYNVQTVLWSAGKMSDEFIYTGDCWRELKDPQ